MMISVYRGICNLQVLATGWFVATPPLLTSIDSIMLHAHSHTIRRVAWLLGYEADVSTFHVSAGEGSSKSDGSVLCIDPDKL